MIHNITCHTATEAWIPIQVQYFAENFRQPYKTWAFVDDAPLNFGQTAFHYCQPSHENHKNGQIRHANKLDQLADKVVQDPETNDDDILIFWDGDSIPVANVDDWLWDYLENWPLLAVQRLENGGDRNPHPLFTACKVEFWKRIGGSWHPDYFPTGGEKGKRWDTGGYLYNILDKEGIEWFSFLRSNNQNWHPLFFGVYGNVVYHHGAAHRLARNPKAKSRMDHQDGLDPEENKRMGDELFEKIKRDGAFWREFV